MFNVKTLTLLTLVICINVLGDIADIATLRNTPVVNNSRVYVVCYSSQGDNGQGWFRGVTGQPQDTYIDDGGTIIVPNNGDGSAAWLREYKSVGNVSWFGAKGDCTNDDTSAIQAAFDATGIKTLKFNSGTYKVSAASGSCLTLSHAKRLVGEKGTRILGLSLATSVDLLTIAITDADGYGDVRQWGMDSVSCAQSGGGRHALVITGGMQIISSYIRNCSFSGNESVGGYALYVYNNLAHSTIDNNTFSNSIYMACYDANVISKNVFFGTRVAITYDLVNGVINNVVRNNTIVNRDGAVHVINGDKVQIHGNQVELYQPYGESQSLTSSFIWLEGRDRICKGCEIIGNNLGGGTNLDNSIYIENGQRNVISKNRLVAVNNAEIYLAADSKYNIVRNDNITVTQICNPRSRTAFKENVVDLGTGNYGVLKDGATLSLANGWTLAGGYFKSEDGNINFRGAFNGGSTASGTLIGVLPTGFKTPWQSYPVCTSGGVGYLSFESNGNIKVGYIPSNASVTVNPIPCTDLESTDY